MIRVYLLSIIRNFILPEDAQAFIDLNRPLLSSLDQESKRDVWNALRGVG